MQQAVEDLLATSETVTSRALAERAGITRQGAHRHLVRLVSQGRLCVEGKARATRYRRTHAATGPFQYATSGLEEDRVLIDLEGRIPQLARLPSPAREVFGYAFLEILNNAIEHSSSEHVSVRVDLNEGALAFEIIDHGIGAWAHLRVSLGLESDLEAIQELSKGKVTTDPSHHTGEGVFFVSKAGDQFEMESGELCWVVDNVRQDTAILAVASRTGTRVSFAARQEGVAPLSEVFARYTEDYAFSKTRTYVRLFALGLRFLSRSEARRMMRGLERFCEVILDFNQVPGVGQAFADEVFRVWSKAHPDIRLSPIEMNAPVAMMVERARRAAASP